jgi:hypothetical protein
MSTTPVYGFPVGPPPKRTRWGLIIGSIAGGLAVLCCCGGGVVIAMISTQTSPAKAAAESYVDAVIAGNDAEALRHVCSTSDPKAHQQFANHVRSTGVSDSEVTNTQVSLWNLSWKATIHMELTSGTGTQEDLTLPLAKEDGEWKVCD